MTKQESMSRRTLPVYSEFSSYLFLNHRRHLGEGNYHCMASRSEDGTSTVKDSSSILFEGLDEGRFDKVRRAIAQDRSCLMTTARHRNHSEQELNVISYALANCRIWNDLAAHCRRTGTGIAQVGDLTFNERQSAMNVILRWLLNFPEVEISQGTPLLTALLCHLDDIPLLLLKRAPHLACVADARGKTPLHVVCTLPSGMSPLVAVKYIRLLTNLGADVSTQDMDGSTPLHEVLHAICQPVAPYGLVRRRGTSLKLESVMPVIDILLAHGASLTTVDGTGANVMNIALCSGLEFIKLIERATKLRERLCGSNISRRWRACRRPISGLWGQLPDDVVIKILSFLSPYDVFSGIGATCTGLRAISTTEYLWSYLELAHCLENLRNSFKGGNARTIMPT